MATQQTTTVSGLGGIGKKLDGRLTRNQIRHAIRQGVLPTGKNTKGEHEIAEADLREALRVHAAKALFYAAGNLVDTLAATSPDTDKGVLQASLASGFRPILTIEMPSTVSPEVTGGRAIIGLMDREGNVLPDPLAVIELPARLMARN